MYWATLAKFVSVVVQCPWIAFAGLLFAGSTMDYDATNMLYFVY